MAGLVLAEAILEVVRKESNPGFADRSHLELPALAEVMATC